HLNLETLYLEAADIGMVAFLPIDTDALVTVARRGLNARNPWLAGVEEFTGLLCEEGPLLEKASLEASSVKKATKIAVQRLIPPPPSKHPRSFPGALVTQILRIEGREASALVVSMAGEGEPETSEEVMNGLSGLPLTARLLPSVDGDLCTNAAPKRLCDLVKCCAGRRSLGLSASPAPDLDVEVSAGIFVTLRPKKETRETRGNFIDSFIQGQVTHAEANAWLSFLDVWPDWENLSFD
ncbi:unnamed protein product, partial [Symbiodinium sp. KB8]